VRYSIPLTRLYLQHGALENGCNQLESALAEVPPNEPHANDMHFPSKLHAAAPGSASHVKHALWPTSHAATTTELTVAPSCTPNLISATAPNGHDSTEVLGEDGFRDGIFEELLQEQPLLDWLEWDLPCLEEM
jgi:hypothetical protein